jgi:hypothetical protein
MVFGPMCRSYWIWKFWWTRKLNELIFYFGETITFTLHIKCHETKSLHCFAHKKYWISKFLQTRKLELITFILVMTMAQGTLVYYYVHLHSIISTLNFFLFVFGFVTQKIGWINVLDNDYSVLHRALTLNKFNKNWINLIPFLMHRIVTIIIDWTSLMQYSLNL